MTAGLNQKLIDCAVRMNVLLPINGKENGAVNLSNDTYPTGLHHQASALTNIQQQATQDWAYGQLPPDDFAFTAYGEFQFPDMAMNFMT